MPPPGFLDFRALGSASSGSLFCDLLEFGCGFLHAAEAVKGDRVPVLQGIRPRRVRTQVAADHGSQAPADSGRTATVRPRATSWASCVWLRISGPGPGG